MGGLVGFNNDNADIEKSYATGDVTGDDDVGGLVGWNSGEIGNSYATGDVTGDDDVGGLVGHDSGGTVTDSYWDDQAATVTEDDEEQDGQGIGDGDGDVTALTTSEMTGDEAEDNMDGFDFGSTWDVVNEDQNGELEVSYPFLVDNEQEPAPGQTTEELYAGGEGTDEDPYLIENWEHLDNVRENLDAEFALNADLDEETDGYGGDGEEGVVLDADGTSRMAMALSRSAPTVTSSSARSTDRVTRSSASKSIGIRATTMVSGCSGTSTMR